MNTEKAVPKLRFSGFTDEWNEVTLNDVATFSKGKGISKNDISDYGIECVRYGELYTKYNEMIYNVESKTNLDKNELKLSEKDDILIPCSGETAIDLATASCIQKDQVAIGGDITVIKTDQYAPFITYYLNQKKTEIAKYAQGVSIVHLYPKDFKVMNIRIPSFNEQKKIIALLEEITKKEQLLESKYHEYQDFKKYLMQQIFAQKLRFNEFDDEWKTVKLSNVAEIVGGGTPNTEVEEYWNGGIKWFTPSEIGKTKYISESDRYISEEGLKNSSAKLLPKNTILLSSRATVGEISIALTECSTNQGFQSLITKNTVDNEFIYYLISTLKNEFLRRSSGSTFLEISKNEIKKIKINIPSLSEQKRISSLFSSIDNKIDLLKIEHEKCFCFKKSLLQQMFI
ncbi:restriction endonuclease subunit S [Methanobrevibacter sp.]|uniref:restriction endonuclease subunit S n=1 Tax=Methanobrevibacter sp. TaxID=66852 RepID=UPI00386FEF4E